MESRRGDTDNSVIRRRRECLKCRLIFTTYEVLEESLVDPIVFDSLNENSGSYFQNYPEIKDYSDLRKKYTEEYCKRQIKFLSIVMKNCPSFALGSQLSERGYVKFKLKNYKGAIEDFSKVIELDADDHTSHRLRGDAKLKIKDYEGAILDLTKGIELIDLKFKKINYIYESNIYDALNKPEYELAFFNRGELEFKLKDFKSAKKDFSKVIQLNPRNMNAYTLRGKIQIELKDYESAIEDFSKVIELNPKNVNAYISRGEAILSSKKIPVGQ